MSKLWSRPAAIKEIKRLTQQVKELEENDAIIREDYQRLLATAKQVGDEIAELRKEHKELFDGNHALMLENRELRKAQGEPVATVICEPNYWSDGHHHEGYRPYIKEDELGALPIGTKLYTSAPTIPEGWELVPIDPTPEMIAALTEPEPVDDPKEDITRMWQAMLAAAPKLPNKGE